MAQNGKDIAKQEDRINLFTFTEHLNHIEY